MIIHKKVETSFNKSAISLAVECCSVAEGSPVELA